MARKTASGCRWAMERIFGFLWAIPAAGAVTDVPRTASRPARPTSSAWRLERHTAGGMDLRPAGDTRVVPRLIPWMDAPARQRAVSSRHDTSPSRVDRRRTSSRRGDRPRTGRAVVPALLHGIGERGDRRRARGRPAAPRKPPPRVAPPLSAARDARGAHAQPSSTSPSSRRERRTRSGWASLSPRTPSASAWTDRHRWASRH